MIDAELATAVEDAIWRVTAEEVMPRWRQLSDDDVFQKSGPHDLVTVADRAAEERLTAALTELLPGSVVVGEESVHAEPERYGTLRNAAPVWIIDPVDGTRQFVRGLPQFCTMVALARHGEVEASWIHVPARQLMATARRGAGARLNGVPLAPGPAPGAPLDVACPHTDHLTERDTRILAPLWREGIDLRPTGSAGLEYLRVARGQLDAVVFCWELAWDHAPGLLLVQEAGGAHRTRDDRPFSLREPNVLPLIAGRDPATVRFLRTLLAEGGGAPDDGAPTGD